MPARRFGAYAASMACAPFADDDAERRRLRLVRRLGLMDTPVEERFDVFTRLAARATGMPIALLSLVDERRVWFKSALGLPPGVTEVPRDAGACGLVAAMALEEDAILVPDARQDPRLRDRDLVTGPFGLRFYAGVPVRAPGGEVLATLCVLDRVPHAPDPRVIEALRDIATGVATAFRIHEMADQVLRDPLTGLGSRRLLDEALAAPARPGRALALLDLDRFRQFNEALGHGAGDAVLRQLGAALGAALGEEDVAIRLGGDEFAVLTTLGEGQDPRAFATRLLRAVRTVRPAPGPWLRLDASVGVATGGGDLVQAADVALYRAKRAGRGRVAVAGPEGREERGVREGRLGLGSATNLLAGLRAALEDPAQLRFVLQPIAALDAPDRPLGFEMLARWRHPSLGEVPPDAFIPAAERGGLSLALDALALRSAAALLPRLPPACRHVAVNVTPSSLALPGALRRLDALLASFGPDFDPAGLCLELTERVVVHEAELLRDVAREVLARGICLALDDFGEGQASLGMLAEIPFTCVKLSSRLVAPLGTPGPAAERAAAILEAVCGMAARLGFRSVAEGVEGEEQLQWLRALGCQQGQGWRIGRPAPPEQWVPRPVAAHG